MVEQFYILLTDLGCSLQGSVSKNKLGHRARKTDLDMMGQSYPIYDCTDTTHLRHFITSHCILL